MNTAYSPRPRLPVVDDEQVIGVPPARVLRDHDVLVVAGIAA